MATKTYDLVVIGAGMTGAGVALDAASRGLSVALIDLGDIASGTSSKSSKMVHGGLRYLQQKEFKLVYENLRERQRLLENAPFLVRPLPFLIPIFANNAVMRKTLVKAYGSALRLYDITGGWRIGKRYKKITPSEAVDHLPTLKAHNLEAAFIYMDARGDDARVALSICRSAALDFNADVATYVRALSVTRDEAGIVNGVICRDELSGKEFKIATRSLVNASGVWADDVFTMVKHDATHHIKPAKGVHVSVPRERLPADVAAVFSVPGDRRSIFVVPFEDAPFTFIGTTDTAYDGSIDTPLCTPEDIEYLLKAANNSTSSNLTTSDITGLWAGLRPLLAPKNGKELSERTADLSRRHQVTDSGDGVVHITGGKWTTYRQMAEDTVDALKPYFSNLKSVRTRNLRFHGTSNWRPLNEIEQHLYQRFGSDAQEILAAIEKNPHLGTSPITGQPYLLAEFVFSAENEMATSLVDLLTRRTRAHLHDARATLKAARVICEEVAPIFGWSTSEIDAQIATYAQLVESEFTSAGLIL